jgi:uncharacterized protein (DUF1800 family)
MRSTTLILSAALIAGCAHPSSVETAMPGTGVAATYTPTFTGDRELLPDEQILHALNRMAYGPRPGDVARVRAIGLDRWITMQLNPETIADSASTRVAGRYLSLSADRADMFRTYQVAQQARNQAQRQMAKMGDTAAGRQDARQAVMMADPTLAAAQQVIQRAVPELQAATLDRAVISERQLYEVMVNFWSNHFSVFSGKGQQERLFLTEYDRDVIRPNAMGNFRALLGAVAHSSAMLFYLDNAQSQADSLHPTLGQLRNASRPTPAQARGRRPLPPFTGALSPEVQRMLAGLSPEERQRLLMQMQQGMNSPQQRQRRGLNENYARELMELHTLGVDGGYTQTDVIEVARALTGWSIAVANGGEFIFRPEAHDAAEKTVLGHKLAAGRGEEDGEEVLNIVARHPSTARFITTKLARHFVSDEPPKSVVDRCAAVFTKTEGDIRRTVGCIVTGPEFFSRAAYRAKVKTPFQVVASALRSVRAEPDATPRAAQSVTQLGQPIFGRQTPDGWPDRADAWMNTGAILGRINFGQMLAAGRVPGIVMGRMPELDSLRSAPREAQVDGVVRLLFGGQVSPDTRQILLSGENPLASALARDTTATAAATASDMGGMPPMRQRPLGGGRGQVRAGPNQMVTLDGLAQVVGLALGAPEFQRR